MRWRQMSVVKDRALFLPNDRNSLLLLLVIWKDFPACVPLARNANRTILKRKWGSMANPGGGLGVGFGGRSCALDVHARVCVCVCAHAIFQGLHFATH